MVPLGKVSGDSVSSKSFFYQVLASVVAGVVVVVISKSINKNEN